MNEGFKQLIHQAARHAFLYGGSIDSRRDGDTLEWVCNHCDKTLGSITLNWNEVLQDIDITVTL